MIFLWKMEFAWGTLMVKDFIQNVQAGIMTAGQFKQVTGQDYQEAIEPASIADVSTNSETTTTTDVIEEQPPTDSADNQTATTTA